MSAIGKHMMIAFAALTIETAVAAAPISPPTLADGFVPTAAEKKRLELMSQPESWFVDHLAGPREIIDGQTLNPKLQFHFEARRARSLEEVKRGLDMFYSAEGRTLARERLARDWALLTKVTAPMRHVEDRSITGRGGHLIPIRIYTPALDEAGPLPILLYFHGGGWLYSNIEAVDRCVRLIANEARAIVISVDYRLAPEHKWPAANDDGEDAFLWARANAATLGGEPSMIGVGGDSAGGHISLAISRRQQAARKPGPLYQLLYYTSVDFTPRYRSYELFGKGYGLDTAFRDFMMPLAFGDADRIASATRELDEGSMAGMPATILVTAGFDVLRDPAQLLARRLEREGVAVTYLNYPTLTHGFLQWSGVVAEAERAAVDSARLFGTAIRGRSAVLSIKAPGSQSKQLNKE